MGLEASWQRRPQGGFCGDSVDLCFSGRRVNRDNNMARETGLADHFKHVW